MKQEEQSGFSAAFERAVKRAAQTEYAERLLNRAAPAVGGLTAAFLAVSWSGAVWPDMPPAMRMAGVFLYGAALAVSLWGLRDVKKPPRHIALERLDRENGPNRPASTYDDIPADDIATDAESRAIWELERARIARSVGSFKAGAPRPDLARHDPYRLRYVALAAVGLSFLSAVQNGEVGERLAQAFDWTPEIVYDTPLKIDAWVNPPSYTGEKPLFIADKEKMNAAEKGYTVPTRSVLTLMVHDKRAVIAPHGKTETAAQACKTVPGSVTQRCEFTLSGDARVDVHRAGEKGISWVFNVTPDLPPRIEAAPYIQGDQAGVTYKLRDEYRMEEPQIELQMKKPEVGTGARPMIFSVPGITR